VDLVTVIRERRSVRKWSQARVDDDLVRQLIDAARWAPSSGNRQPWYFLVVRSAEAKALLHSLLEQHAASAQAIIMVFVDVRSYGRDERKYVPYLDGAVAIENMLLRAHDLGLGACWHKFGPHEAKRDRSAYTRLVEMAQLARYFTPISALSIGFPAAQPPAPARRAVCSLYSVV